MLPASYQLPAAATLVIAGLVACFFGYRMFRGVLAAVLGLCAAGPTRVRDVRSPRPQYCRL